MNMASEDCASDPHPFLLEPLETKAVVAAGEGFLWDVGVQGEVASDAKTPAESTGIEEDETVQERCGLSDPMETPVQGVRTEAREKELIQEVDGFLTENEAAGGVEGGEIKEAACRDEGTEEAPGEEPIENSWSNGASDAVPDAKTIQAKVSNKEELVKPPEYQEEENIKIPKAEAVENPSVENVATDTMASKLEKQLTEEESEYDLDQEKENDPPIVIEAEDNAVVEDVGRENIVSDTPLAEGEVTGENGVKEQITDEREGAEPEPEEKLIVEDAANEIIASKKTERVAGLMDGTGNDDPIEYTIPTPEPPNASEVVAMDRAAEAAEDGPIRTVGVEQKEKLETDTLTFEPVRAPEFDAKSSLEKEGIEAKASEKGDAQVLAEKIVCEIDEGKVENTLRACLFEAGTDKSGQVKASQHKTIKFRVFRILTNSKFLPPLIPILTPLPQNKHAVNSRSEVIEAEERDSTKKPPVTTLVLNGEGNARKEQGKGKQSGKLMSRVRSSLGKVRKAIVGKPSPSSKTIVVDARLEEKVQ